MIHQQAMLMIVSLFHDTSTSNVNDRDTIPGYINQQCYWSCQYHMIHQQAMLMIVSQCE